MLVIDEYLAMRVLVGARPDELADDEPLALPAYRHYRLLQRVHQPGTGQLSALLAEGDQQAIRRPHPEVLGLVSATSSRPSLHGHGTFVKKRVMQ